MGGLEPLAVVWKGWVIQVMVLLSFAVQVTLLLLADVRRRKDSTFVKAIIWSAYVLADTTAIYALGHMSLVSPEHHLMALWAPLLLVHLGGQDNITAYAIEDNRLWLRHLQTLGVQVLAAAYVLYVSTVLLGSRTLLRSAAILMFVVGVLKYGERILALLCASNCASSSLSARNYRSMHRRPEILPAPPAYRRRDTQGLQLIAYTLLDVPKQMLEGPTRYVKIEEAYLLEGEEMLRVVEMQLSMMYDLLYTKAAVVHTWYGWCIRVFSLPATVAALVLFHGSAGDQDGRSGVDVVATYVLLGGAVVLETTSVLRALCSSWTCALLLKGRWDRAARAVTYLPKLVSWATRTGYTKRYMGQHSLFRLCVASRNNASSRMARWMGREDRWGSTFYSWSTPVSTNITEMVVDLVSTTDTSLFVTTNSRGRGYLRAIGQDLEWSVDLDLDESILVWHIATHLYLREQKGATDHVALELSNYMFFLLAARPCMLPYPVSRQRYVQVCYDAITSREDLLGLIQDQVRAWTSTACPGEFEIDYPCGSHRNETLDRGCRLAIQLINITGEASQSNKLDEPSLMVMICRVWVEILCYAAYWCNENSHAKHLSDGGEIMTTVALLMLYNSRGLINKKEIILPQQTSSHAAETSAWTAAENV